MKNKLSEKYIICSRLGNFKKTIEFSMKLLDGIEQNFFGSPYSVIPLISQILGLNAPLMGSGDSPYAITSIVHKMNIKILLFRKLFQIPLIEKRMIVDEIYDMIAPCLLREEEKYICLLINTKYKKFFRGNQIEIKKFHSLMKKKFTIITHFVNKFLTRQGDFGYIVHYGYFEDLCREHSFLRKLSRKLSEEWRYNSFPIVNEVVLNNFPIYKGLTKSCLRGWVIFIPNYTKELLLNGKLRKRKILQAALLAEKLGAKIVGMGGLVASFAQGGQWLSEQIKNVGFTTGHAYTISNILEIMKKSVERAGLDLKRARIAIVGAAGSIGSGCARFIAEKKPCEIFLFDLNLFDTSERLVQLKNQIGNIAPRTKIHKTFEFEDIKKADIVIVATNSPVSIVRPDYLKKGAIVIDDSFPKNVSKGILKKRNDIILLDGGIMQLPLTLDIFFARNMPDLMDAPLTRAVSCKETYGCFAEILVLSLYNYKKNYGLGYSDITLAKQILSKAKKVGFAIAPLQAYDEAVDEERFVAKRTIARAR